MKSIIPASELEAIFAVEAPSLLPLQEAEISRDESGNLSYRWPSPCKELGGLWIEFLTNEIVLGTHIFHDHFDQFAFEVEDEMAKGNDPPRAVVLAAIESAANILSGESVFSINYDRDRRPTSYGMSPKDVINPARDGTVQVISEYARFWDWFGEVRAV